MEEQITAPVEPEQLPEETAGETASDVMELPQETVELVEVSVDYGTALAQLQTTADCILAAIIILCGVVVGSALSFFLRDLWRA